MKTSKNGIKLITQFEGCRLVSYQDSGGVWTIGYGHTSGVYKGMTITQEQAEKYFHDDIKPIEEYLNSLNIGLTQGQYDALVSFAYNIGLGRFKNSTMLRCVKATQFKAASEQQQCPARMAGQGSNRGKDAELRPVAEETTLYSAAL